MPPRIGKDNVSSVISTRLEESEMKDLLKIAHERNERSPASLVRSILRNEIQRYKQKTVK